MGIEWLIAICLIVPVLLYFVRRMPRAKLQVAPWENSEPLTDDEFVARCKSGVKAETALKVRAIIAYQLAIPAEHIHPEHRLVEDLFAD